MSHVDATLNLVVNTDLVLILCANMMCYADVRVCERGDDILSRLAVEFEHVQSCSVQTVDYTKCIRRS